MSGWAVLKRENRRAAESVVEAEMRRARAAVCAALDLGEDEAAKWEESGKERWQERLNEEVLKRDHTLEDDA